MRREAGASRRNRMRPPSVERGRSGRCRPRQGVLHGHGFEYPAKHVLDRLFIKPMRSGRCRPRRGVLRGYGFEYPAKHTFDRLARKPVRSGQCRHRRGMLRGHGLEYPAKTDAGRRSLPSRNVAAAPSHTLKPPVRSASSGAANAKQARTIASLDGTAGARSGQSMSAQHGLSFSA